jgi:hypothetical protein
MADIAKEMDLDAFMDTLRHDLANKDGPGTGAAYRTFPKAMAVKAMAFCFVGKGLERVSRLPT